MAVTLINPDGLVEPQGYTHVAVAQGSRMIFLAGQVGQDAQGKVAGDLAAQTEQALRNVGTALAAAGATFADVVKTTIYVVDWQPEKAGDLFAGLQRSGAGSPGPTTLIGVAALAAPDLLVEFDVTAVAA
ncbi:RidA family protein [Actinoplanes auranticolor]|uniref:Enamine deaminase RidA n=1 Tax=Actinoplanes auranticolor TaxID=47988 RepID=A0A919SWH4_9ACTN|nr:RidA family protein [Actinoplanes auranticolor]GIM78318.1 enamine deaminase RidA [Actinoplanes auranticolor]